MSKYILKNKDKNVLEFEIETIEKDTEFMGKILTTKISNITLINENLLPKSIKEKSIKENLNSWILSRKVPKNREFVDEIIATYKKDTEEKFMDYVDISLALSLNDSFWIIPSDKDYKWKDYNLYNNEFSEALKLTAFGVHLTKIKHLTSSPEYTTNGMLRKCWHKENGKIYLYKANSTEYANSGKEAYSEYYMAQVAKIMEFDHIEYDLKKFHNYLVSSCEIFTNENEGYIPIYYCLNKENLEHKNLDSLIAIANIYGEDKLSDLMVFDALIYNPDRHLGNFGMIVDNDTGKILRPAPIFDNGCSMLNSLTKEELNNINRTLNLKTSYFDFNFDEQLYRFIKPRHAPNLKKLSSFAFKRHKEFNLSEEWLKPIEECIRTRAIMALKFIREKQNVNIQNYTQSQNQNSYNETKEKEDKNLSLEKINSKLNTAIENQKKSQEKPRWFQLQDKEQENLENSNKQILNKKLNKRR